MVDVDSIKRASELVNSALYAKGYFHEKDNLERLLFKSIDDDSLTTTEAINENDKIVLNTLYALLQELDKSKVDKQYLQEQIHDKKEIIGHFESSNKELNLKNASLKKENGQLKNEIEVLKLQLKRSNGDNLINGRNLNKEKLLINSLKVKHEKEIKKKSLMINQLQDRLINRKKKYDNVITGNNYSAEHKTQQDTSLVLDEEMEKMMINLSNLISNLTLQNDKNINFISFLNNYLNLLNEYYNKKQHQQESINLPPTPRFYHENYQKDPTIISSENNEPKSQDVSVKLTQMINFQKLEPVVFKSLDEFYELLTNDDEFPSIQSQPKNKKTDNDKIGALQKEIETLKKNLEVALETNEKWSKKFQSTK